VLLFHDAFSRQIRLCVSPYPTICDDRRNVKGPRRNLRQCATFHPYSRRIHGGQSSFAVSFVSEPAMVSLELQSAAAGTRGKAPLFSGKNNRRSSGCRSTLSVWTTRAGGSEWLWRS
jgi:hypothetical protein